MTATIWHNPRCSKSRATLALLEENKIDHEVRLYLNDPPSVFDLKLALEALDMTPGDLVRRSETEYRDAGLTKASDDEALLAAMAQFPKLIERPVVIVGANARIGRPPEAVLELFD